MNLNSFLKQAAAHLGGTNLFRKMATPGEHEARISGIFGKQCRYEGDTVVFPRPLVILAFTNRSGSNLMADYIRQANYVGGLGEFLNHDGLARRVAKRNIPSFPEYIHDLHREYSPVPKSLGIKASWDQMAMLLRWNIPAMFPRVTVIHVMRHDMVAQAVSYGIALQTKQWSSRHAADGSEPVANSEQVADSMIKFHNANLMIRLITEAAGMERFDIGYEQIVTDPSEHVVRLLHKARLAGTDWMPQTPGLSKQGGGLNRAFEDRFRADLLHSFD
jgi:LPS sulfotransferase NodH